MRTASTLVLIWLAAGCTHRPSGPESPVDLELTFDTFHDGVDVVRWFEALADAYPRWFRTESMGTSVQGRPIPVIRITDHDAPGSRVGYWVDGAIHGGELGSQEPALGLVEHLRTVIVAGRPPAWLGRICVHVAPILNPDGIAVSIRSPFLYQRHNLQPVDDDGDGKADEDGPQDVNGDGYVGLMYRGDRYLSLERVDADGDGKFGEDPLGGYDLNRNYPIPAGTVGSRSYEAHSPKVQPETRAVMSYWRRHPGIKLALSYHTSANVVVRPDVASKEKELPIQRICDLFSTHIVKREPIKFPISQHASSRGTTMEWFLRECGAVAVTIEMNPLPDAPKDPHDGGHSDHRFPVRGDVRISRRTGGFGRSNSDRLHADLQRTVDKHVAFLLAVVELIT